ncbi:MAG: SDR family oxidoreductase [Bacteroidetes bacterium]|jgi:UDP-glucose 4-epimerase|nr:SDR family oxidoreductase [Bacteroidota bacterium]
MKFLITGGAGFIGSNIVERLVQSGETVRVFDNFATGKRENLDPYLSSIELIEGDLRSFHAVREAVDGMEVVIHLGALPSVPRSIKDPLTTNEVNVVGTLNVLDAGREAGVKRVVFASSSSVYGENHELPKHEGMVPEPVSPYAVSKLAGEKYCSVFSRVYGLSTVSLRYFNVFGPRQDPTSQYSAVIPKFITAIHRGESPTVYGDGKQSRDFTHVANVVDANLKAATADCPSGSVMNIACQERTSLLELIDRINAALGRSVSPIFAPQRMGEVRDSLASIEAAQRLIDYVPTVRFDEGLRRTIEWFTRRSAVH